MSYQFARIDLSQTTYTPAVDWYYITQPDIAQLNNIYKTYCTYKHFASVMPIFDSQYTDSTTDIVGYQCKNKLVAFSLMKRYDNHNVLASQFAWTYHNPKTRLGIESLKTECAIYRERGFKYLYLDQVHLYKQDLEGFEILGTLE